MASPATATERLCVGILEDPGRVELAPGGRPASVASAVSAPAARDRGLRARCGARSGSRYRQGVEGRPDWRPSSAVLARVVLAAFVLAWVFGPYWLRSTVPIWLVFAVAVGLELHFVVSAVRAETSRRPGRGPQTRDLERYGYAEEAEELLLVRDGGDELWISYAGETGDELDALIEGARSEEGDEQPAEPVPATGRHGRWSSPILRFAAGIAVIGALAALVWVVQAHTGWDSLADDSRQRTVTRISEEASRIAGKPVSMRCDESGSHVGFVQDADGVATVGGTLAYLTPERCYDLYRLAFEGETTSSRTARALAVLAHEAWHLRGVSDEGTTECYAFQSGVALGQRLGLSQDTAAQMMRQQLVENVDRGASNLEYLVPGECRSGGRLDLDPALERFP